MKMNKVLKIGTRESQLAVWQANEVKELLANYGYASELVYIKSDGDIDLQTPLYEIGVQGIFTRSLDIALLNNRIDLAVHSMKDVPTQLPKGISQASVLERASFKDIFVFKNFTSVQDWDLDQVILDLPQFVEGTIATSSIRRKAQWLQRYPNHRIENLRGNVNTRMRKVQESHWDGAIFAAAGLERIGLRPQNSIDLDWMLPAPAQGAIMVVCRQDDEYAFNACQHFNDASTALCTKIERDFLKALMGGCSTPISALAQIRDGILNFQGSILSTDGKQKAEVELQKAECEAGELGYVAAGQILENGGNSIVQNLKEHKAFASA